MVHSKSWRIVEVAIRLELYEESLSSDAIAAHILECIEDSAINQNGDYLDEKKLTWEDDSIEVARRRWEWWRAKRGKFTYFSKAARLVVLVQVSSAAVERIFSQVKYILEQIGDSALEENIECRMMERIINKYDEY